MIVVSVMLHSAVTGETTEIARTVIHNVGGDATNGDYEAFACRGRDKDALHKNMLAVIKGELPGYPIRHGRVNRHKRLKLHVWHLVAKALTSMGYGNQ